MTVALNVVVGLRRPRRSAIQPAEDVKTTLRKERPFSKNSQRAKGKVEWTDGRISACDFGIPLAWIPVVVQRADDVPCQSPKYSTVCVGALMTARPVRILLALFY